MEYFSEPVRDEWLDHYQHLNEAYYLVAFSNATWALQCTLGIGKKYFDQTGHALYTVESHICYLKEVRAPAILKIKSMLFDFQQRKIWIGHQMEVDGTIRATFECILIHFDTINKKVAAFPEKCQKTLKIQKEGTPPNWVGKSVSFSRS